MTTYIYALECPETNEIRYVGKADNLIKRYRQHLRVGGSHEKMRWIDSLLAKGLKPNLIVLEEAPWDNWQEVERWWITQLWDHGCPLLNRGQGGEGGNRIEYYGPEGMPYTHSALTLEFLSRKSKNS